MLLSRDEVRTLVISSIREVAENKNDDPIVDETDPIHDLGLDSNDGVDFACAISEKLNYDVPDNINPLVSDKPTRPRKVGEIVDLMCNLLQESERHARGDRK
ncbi:MAG: phosphopantetheine-binding protein [Acidobacteriota bacterium]